MDEIRKLIASREKSIEVLAADVEKFEALHKASTVAVARDSLASVLQVKRARLSKLRAELVGFRSALAAQQELPAVGPEVRKGKS